MSQLFSMIVVVVGNLTRWKNIKYFNRLFNKHSFCFPHILWLFLLLYFVLCRSEPFLPFFLYFKFCVMFIAQCNVLIIKKFLHDGVHKKIRISTFCYNIYPQKGTKFPFAFFLGVVFALLFKSPFLLFIYSSWNFNNKSYGFLWNKFCVL